MGVCGAISRGCVAWPVFGAVSRGFARFRVRFLVRLLVFARFCSVSCLGFGPVFGACPVFGPVAWSVFGAVLLGFVKVNFGSSKSHQTSSSGCSLKLPKKFTKPDK